MSPSRIIDIVPVDHDAKEVTVYVKGFLSPGEEPEHFSSWVECHRALERRLGWGRYAQGYCWPSGGVRAIPAPVTTIARVGWDIYRRVRGVGKVSVLSHVGFFLGEEAVRMVLSFIGQYIAARRWVTLQAADLAEHLRGLTANYQRVRVVAHSLGCLQVIEAVSQLSPQSRPQEVHLCAPACCEAEVSDKLPRLVRQDTTLYFAQNDWVLEIVFRAVSVGPALGSAGPEEPYQGLITVNVSQHFGFWVHGQYKNQFAEFAWG